ncbi:odorant receptor 10a [Orussus abietinus]|uniref:odorant receptor 10a n=1 Tax=Orussus abietinus TaxID=222816 RepID=UPI000626103F|nr:odorant receptor 10a [Orussus abietinus]XP_012284960.1 odorant receptor 10a [Orussus abietinus]
MEIEIDWSRRWMRLLGVWPDPKLTKKTDDKWALCRCIVPGIVIVGVMQVPQSMRLVAFLGDLDETVEIMMAALVPATTCLMKLIYLWIKKEVLRPVISSIIQDWTRPKTNFEKDLMLQNARLSQKIGKTFFAMMYVAVLFYVIRHAFNEVQRRLSNNTEVEQEFVLHANYPFDTSSTWVYILVYFLQVFSDMYAALLFVTFDSFIFMLVLHLCAQIKIQRSVIKNFAIREMRSEFQAMLRSVVTRYDHLSWFTRKIEDSFNNVFLSQFLACTLQFCFLGFKFLMIPRNETRGVIFIQGCCVLMYTLSLFLVPFMYCYLGECLHDESTGLCESCYEYEWYNLSPHEAKCLMFIMLRSQHPLQITAGKFSPLMFRTFAQLWQTSAGYLSMLIAVKDRIIEQQIS